MQGSPRFPQLKFTGGTSLVVQLLRYCTPSAWGPGSIPCQGTVAHMLHLRACVPQPKTPHTTAKTRDSQINTKPNKVHMCRQRRDGTLLNEAQFVLM